VDDGIAQRLADRDPWEVLKMDLLPLRKRQRSEAPSRLYQLHDTRERDDQWVREASEVVRLSSRRGSVHVNEAISLETATEEDLPSARQTPVRQHRSELAKKIVVRDPREALARGVGMVAYKLTSDDQGFC
jgi:hypothetical protein